MVHLGILDSKNCQQIDFFMRRKESIINMCRVIRLTLFNSFELNQAMFIFCSGPTHLLPLFHHFLKCMSFHKSQELYNINLNASSSPMSQFIKIWEKMFKLSGV